MTEGVPLHRLAQLMGHDSLNTTLRYVRGTRADCQAAVEGIAWRGTLILVAYERRPETVAALHWVAFACLMLHRVMPFLTGSA